MKKINELWNQYYEVITYLIFGGLTTLINLICYYGLNIATHNTINNTLNICISWFISVLFAFITNKIWVFRSKTNGFKAFLDEGLKFFGSRIGTLIFEIIFMWFFVDILHQNQNIFKLIAQVAIIVLNYILSKLIVFKDDKSKA